MKRQYLGLGLLVVGCALFTRKVMIQSRDLPGQVGRPSRGSRANHPFAKTYRISLEYDIPPLGLRRGDTLIVCPEAPIHLGELVVLKMGSGAPVLACYQDELMDCVAGLAVIEGQRTSTHVTTC